MDETRPWPRAQSMPFVVAGERAQPHHYQAVAKYDEVRGETTARHAGGSVYTAAQVNQAIEWWNRRAELEAAADAAAAAPEPMPDERLAQLRAGNEPLGDHLSGLTADEVGELLAEVDRMRALEMPVHFLHVDPEDVTPDQIAECQALWDRLAAAGVRGYDLTPLPRNPG